MSGAAITREAALNAIGTAGPVPLPGRGRTLERWRRLADWGAQDLALAKVVEAHFDAEAILADLGNAPLQRAGELWAVWAANDPRHVPRAAVAADGAGGAHGATLTGSKAWCSGSEIVTHALMTAESEQGPLLVAVAMAQPGVRHDTSGWQGVGMRAIPSGVVHFDGAAAQIVAPLAGYLERPGFWHGGAGIAACWWGAAAAVGEVLRAALKPERAHAAALLGRVSVSIEGAAHTLRALAAAIDADPAQARVAEVYAARLQVRQAALATIDQVSDALGPGPLCADAAHAQRCADLAVWVRQHHAGGDDAALGTLVHRRAEGWAL